MANQRSVDFTQDNTRQNKIKFSSSISSREIYLTIWGLSFNITFGLYQINNDRESIKKNG